MDRKRGIKRAAALVAVLAVAFSSVSPMADVFGTGDPALAATTGSETLDVGSLWSAKKEALSGSGSYWFNSGGGFDHWADTDGITAYSVDADNTEVEVIEDYTVAESVYSGGTTYFYHIAGDSAPAVVEDGTAGGNAYSDSIGIPYYYYTLNSETRDGVEYIYPTYYVSTAKQLKHLLNNLSGAWKGSAIKITDENGTVVKRGEDKVSVKLLCDIDLGGTGLAKAWSFKGDWTSYILDIDGDGHTVYNGYFQYGSFIEIGSHYTGVSIRNATFSNMYIPHAGGLFGNGARHAYFYNVDFTDCYAESAGNSTTIVLGNSYDYCFFKECTVKDSYICTSGGHGAFFASYNGIGECNKDDGSPCTTEIPPTLEEIEAIWGSGSDKDNYPSIFEDCQAVDSEIYFTGETDHQGTFVSCTQGGEIFRRCFSNCAAYGNQKIGVFTGACIGSGNGFKMNVAGEGETYVNTYFEDCFTSGTIEGKTEIGGFIGMVYDDTRADGNSDEMSGAMINGERGICYFKNCYSTSAVGMQYSGSRVGGFAGYVRAYNGTTPHRFANCYAAGEVGGITTETSNDGNATAIGGFFGTYDDGYVNNESLSTHTVAPAATNCYYDKQTTAMRERGIGDDDENSDLNDTVNGLEGIYTKKSETKNVKGLTDSTTELFGSTYAYVNEYYPQIGGILNAGTATAGSTGADAMLANRAKIKKYYSLASAATVFLEHYDKTLSGTQYGDSAERTETADVTAYDTVRDITRIFTFTSAGGAGNLSVTWEKNTELNDGDGFAEYLGQKSSSEKGFTLTYDDTDADGNTAGSYVKTFTPEVLDLAYTDGKYQCISFAPGKQWVQVQAGEGTVTGGETANTVTGTVIGKRNLRLLPTAYIDAGDTVTVTVAADGENGDGYKVEIEDIAYGNGTRELSRFNHAAGVAYAVSDKNRMTGSTYKGQEVSEYAGGEDTDSFAITGKYRVDGTSEMDGEITGEFGNQVFAGLGYDNASDDTETARAMVKVWKAAANTSSGELEDDEDGYVCLDPDPDGQYYENYLKWSGEEEFTVEDIGYYYLHYYWRLDDGRYLEDIKLVHVVVADAYVEMRTGILESSLPDGVDDATEVGDVDQYVYTGAGGTQADGMTDGNRPEWDTNGSLFWWKDYPTKDGSYASGNAGDYYNGDGGSLTLYDDPEFTYSVKSIRKVTNSASNVVGWYNTSEYKMTTLILEVSDGSSWTEMARVEVGDGEDAIYELDDAQYEAAFETYTVTQDKITRKYRITPGSTTNVAVRFSVHTYNDDTADADKVHMTGDAEDERYIVLDVTAGNGTGTSTTLQNPIRVTALYQKAEASITAQKEVLLPDATPDSPDAAYPEIDAETYDENNADTGKATADGNTRYFYTDSLQGMDDARSMDNSGKDDDAEDRHAVLEGDVLTYRVRLKNPGYNPATDVVFEDPIPEGCTYVTGSAKVYSQSVDFTSGVIKYGPVKAVDAVETTCRDGILKVRIGTDGNEAWIDYKTEYYVYFQVEAGSLAADADRGEIENTAGVSYTYEDTSTGDVAQTEVSSNTVETDQVHLYFKIRKEITEADAGRSFLFKVERYDAEGDTEAAGTYYVTLRFAEGETSVEKALQVDKEGYYVVTEVDGWSGTDYAENGGSGSVRFERTNKLEFYSSDADADAGSCTQEADFVNTLDEYAYSDSQSYAYNRISAAD